MGSVALYRGIIKSLLGSTEFMNLMGLSNADAETKSIRIQRRRKPQNILKNLPLVAYYTPDGSKDTDNVDVYCPTFVFDIYTNDNVELAQNIGELIKGLFADKLVGMSNITSYSSNFECEFESDAGLDFCYCWTIVMTFRVNLVRED